MSKRLRSQSSERMVLVSGLIVSLCRLSRGALGSTGSLAKVLAAAEVGAKGSSAGASAGAELVAFRLRKGPRQAGLVNDWRC
jgi:hypothetical protein